MTVAVRFKYAGDDPDERRSKQTNNEPKLDRRSEARRDRDRIFYAGEFARLEAVTQVATLASFSVHNRLTHSYRVEQVARSIAVKLRSDGHEVDEDVVMAASLSHDIGHPPFGHTGEVALQQALLCEDHKVMETNFNGRQPQQPNNSTFLPACGNTPPCLLVDSFEGNAQTFRVLARLGAKYIAGDKISDQIDHYGLDLTRRSLAATAKYPWTKGGKSDKPAKWGAYDCDAGVLEWVQGVRDSCDVPLEAQIMDRADDIAYAVHDLEDFYKSNAIPLSEIQLGTETFVRILDYIRGEQESLGNKSILRLQKEYVEYSAHLEETPDPAAWRTPLDVAKYPVLAYVQTHLATFPDTRYSDDVEGRQILTRFRSRLISNFIDDLEVSGDAKNLNYKSNEVAIFIEFLKQLTWYYVIDDSELAMVRQGQALVVTQCFTQLYAQAKALWVKEDNDRKTKKPTPHETKSLPPRLVQYVLIGIACPGRYFAREVIARAVVDYLCSLTDPQTYALAAQLSGSAAHAVPAGLTR